MEARAFGPDSVAATLALGLEDGDEFHDLGLDRGPADHAVELGEGGVEGTHSGAHGDCGSAAHGGGSRGFGSGAPRSMARASRSP